MKQPTAEVVLVHRSAGEQGLERSFEIRACCLRSLQPDVHVEIVDTPAVDEPLVRVVHGGFRC